MSDLSRLKPSWTQKSSHISSQNLFYFKTLIAGKIMHPAVRLYSSLFPILLRFNRSKYLFEIRPRKFLYVNLYSPLLFLSVSRRMYTAKMVCG